MTSLKIGDSVRSGAEGHSAMDGNTGGQPARHDRSVMERQLPYTTGSFIRSDHHIFDGNEASFSAWKWRLEHQLRRMGVLYTLHHSPPEEDCANPISGASEEEEAKRREKYVQRLNDDEVAVDEIAMCVNNTVLNKLVGVTYAKEAMDTLMRTYQKTGTASIINLRQRLFQLGSRKFESIENLFDEYDTIIRELDRMGAAVSISERVHSLIIAMPDRFKHVKGALTVLTNEELCSKSILDIKRMFLDADSILPASNRDANVALKAALPKKDVVCFGCGKAGHYKNRCPKKNDQRKIEQCFEPQRGSQRFAMVATAKSAKTSQQKRRVRFVVDSGATEHLVNDANLLDDATELEEPVEISTAKTGQVLQGMKKGSVTLNSVVGLNKIKKLKLYNVVFVPELESNLFSVRRASSMGKRVRLSWRNLGR